MLRTPAPVLIAVVTNSLCGLSNFLLGGAHLLAVLRRALEGKGFAILLTVTSVLNLIALWIGRSCCPANQLVDRPSREATKVRYPARECRVRDAPTPDTASATNRRR